MIKIVRIWSKSRIPKLVYRGQTVAIKVGIENDTKSSITADIGLLGFVPGTDDKTLEFRDIRTGIKFLEGETKEIDLYLHIPSFAPYNQISCNYFADDKTNKYTDRSKHFMVAVMDPEEDTTGEYAYGMIEQFQIPTQVKRGENFDVTISVKNVGQGTADMSAVALLTNRFGDVYNSDNKDKLGVRTNQTIVLDTNFSIPNNFPDDVVYVVTRAMRKSRTQWVVDEESKGDISVSGAEPGPGPEPQPEPEPEPTPEPEPEPEPQPEPEPEPSPAGVPEAVVSRIQLEPYREEVKPGENINAVAEILNTSTTPGLCSGTVMIIDYIGNILESGQYKKTLDYDTSFVISASTSVAEEYEGSFLIIRGEGYHWSDTMGEWILDNYADRVINVVKEGDSEKTAEALVLLMGVILIGYYIYKKVK